MLTALIVFACVNGTIPIPAIRDLSEVERLVERGEYQKARDLLHGHSVPPELEKRANDLYAVVLLRLDLDSAREPPAWVLQHFIDRERANKQDPRFKAWLAEAHLAAGNSAQALALIVKLAETDLMPDHFAYVTLAKLSIGPSRTSALATCRTRAKVKSLCKV